MGRKKKIIETEPIEDLPYRCNYDEMLEENKIDSLDAFDIIKGVELTHTEYMEDEDWDGNWTQESWEVFDGTINERYPYLARTIEQDLRNYHKLKKRIIEMLEFFKSEIDTGVDVFGDKVEGANMLVALNCYNRFDVLKGMCEEKKDEGSKR